MQAREFGAIISMFMQNIHIPYFPCAFLFFWRRATKILYEIDSAGETIRPHKKKKEAFKSTI
jgi:hypothetical protein